MCLHSIASLLPGNRRPSMPCQDTIKHRFWTRHNTKYVRKRNGDRVIGSGSGKPAGALDLESARFSAPSTEKCTCLHEEDHCAWPTSSVTLSNTRHRCYGGLPENRTSIWRSSFRVTTRFAATWMKALGSRSSGTYRCWKGMARPFCRAGGRLARSLASGGR